MDGWMDEWMDGWMDEWMDGWMDGWMAKCDLIGTKINGFMLINSVACGQE